MSYAINEEEMIKKPEYYEQKANQLRLQNQILRRQLESNMRGGDIKRTVIPPPNFYSTIGNPANYSFHNDVPVQQVIYNPVTEPIRPPSYFEQRTSFQNYPKRALTEFSVIPERQQRYPVRYLGPSGDWQRKVQINQVEQEIIELQARGYKLEREANRLSSYIKEDLRDFIRDSNIQKQCGYKLKYLRAISNRPRYFRFNM